MMKLICVLAGVLLWTTPLMAETYSWVDESGTYNFTEDYSRVPKKYRGKVGKRDDMGAPAVPKESVAAPKVGNAAAAPATSKDAPAVNPHTPVGSFGGKSYVQWQQELRERETAMAAITKQVAEMDAVLNKNFSDREKYQSLLAERNKLVGQFKDMRKEYDQHVEKARKAGIQVEIKQ